MFRNTTRRSRLLVPRLQTLEDRSVPSTWVGSAAANGNLWSVATNWIGGVPGPGGTAVFQAAGTLNFSSVVDAKFTIAAVTIDSTWGSGAMTGTIYIDQPLTVTGISKWEGGNISINKSNGGYFSQNGTMTLAFPNNGPSLLGGGTLYNNGTIHHSGAAALTIGDLSVLNISIGGLYDFQSNAGIIGGIFSSDGILRRTAGAGTLVINAVDFKSLGPIDVQTGTLSIYDGAHLFGNDITVATGATFDLAGNGFSLTDLTGAFTGHGGGTVLLANGALHFSGNTTFDFPPNMFQWQAGSLSFAPGITLFNVGQMTLANGLPINLPAGATLLNNGTIRQTGFGQFILRAGATLTNVAGAVYDFQATDTIIGSLDLPLGTFTNAGTIRRSVGAGTATIATVFNNTGPIDVQTGTLALAPQAGTNYGTTTTNDFTVATGATLDLTGGFGTNAYSGQFNSIGGGTVLLKNSVLNIIDDTDFGFPADMFQWKGGTLNIAAGKTLTNFYFGQINLANAGGVSLDGGGTLKNFGTIRQTGAGSLLNGLNVATPLINADGGLYDIQSTKTTMFGPGSFTNAGTLRRSVGTGTATISAPFTNTGTIDVQTGTLDTPGTLTLSGVLQGNGILLSPVTNSSGSVRPGNSPGKLTVTGTYAQIGTGNLTVELNGTAPGTGYDQLVVNGAVILTGELKVFDTFGATVTNAFTIIANDGSDSITGTFNNLPEGKVLTSAGGDFTISYVGGTGNDVTLTCIAVRPPTVASVVINDGDPQRSRVTKVEVTFDSVVTLPAMPESAFELRRQIDSALVGLTAGVVNDTVTHVTLTFTGAVSDFGSLKDGRYTLTVFAGSVSNPHGQLDGNGNGTGGDDYVLAGNLTNKLFRLFGDSDGDGTVAANDFIQFRLALGGNNPIFDFDNDGAVAASDFIQFRLRFGGSI